MTKESAKINRAEIRMYRMGTGDCFILKFFAENEERFKMMIDCGTWQGEKVVLENYVKDLKAYVNNNIDVLVITHEHKDHVYGFEACEKLFTENFKVKELWLGWSENDEDGQVKQWQQDFGTKKKALVLASNKLNKLLQDNSWEEQWATEAGFEQLLGWKQSLAETLNDFSSLQLGSAADRYIGMLKGMQVIKEKLKVDRVRYFKPGDIFRHLPIAEGLKFYVLGPPSLWEEVKKESGIKGEAYPRNALAQSDAFAAAVLHDVDMDGEIFPFDRKFQVTDRSACAIVAQYESKENQWRSIGYDWLDSAALLALRLDSATNNLSLAFAIEFEASGKVLLFPGDAEYGSWESWHQIPWKEQGKSDKGLTADLLSRTIFYKVAHHLSHNGTPQRLGLELMNHPDLVAMATLDYRIISSSWKRTMPNKALTAELLERTKGRLMVMNEQGILFDQQENIDLSTAVHQAQAKLSKEEYQAFQRSLQVTPLYISYTLDGGLANI